MIGHFLLHLTSPAEDRVLLGAMRPGNLGPCLLVTIHQNEASHRYLFPGLARWSSYAGRCPLGERFDALCYRFGIVRVTAAIRTRIWSNRARRTLSGNVVANREMVS